MKRLDPFALPALRALSEIIANRYSGSEITDLFKKAGFPNIKHDGSTKWRFVYGALEQLQKEDYGPYNVAKIIEALCNPQEYFGQVDYHTNTVEKVNEILSFYGLEVDQNNGKIVIKSSVKPSLSRPTIKKEQFIPSGYQFLSENCKKFFRDHPHYDKNIFIMTRFVKGNKLLEELDSELRAVLGKNGLNPVRADDKMYLTDRNLWNNICVYMICCKHGITILEDRIENEFNPNVALEYGFMRALNKPTLLLADTGFRNLRADIIGTLRESFDITDIKGTVCEPVEKWLKELDVPDPIPENPELNSELAHTINARRRIQ